MSGIEPKLDKAINVLAIGQSNMVGNFGPAEERAPKNVRVWDWYRRELSPARLGQRPFIRLPDGQPAGNMALRFCDLIQENLHKPVNLALFAANGVKIEYFLPSTVLKQKGWISDQHNNHFGNTLSEHIFGPNSHTRKMLKSVKSAHYDVLLIHQGEANIAYTPENSASLAEKYLELINQMDEEGIIAQSSFLLFGKVNPKYRLHSVHANALARLVDHRIRIVEWDGIEDVDGTTQKGNLHATATGLLELGHRYYQGYVNALAEL